MRNFGFGRIILFLGLVFVGMYFTFTAVQGNSGLFRRIQIEAEIAEREGELNRLEAETTHMENLTRRLSDDFLDLDLLDERVRAILGYIRADELVLPQ
jgi:cell division protein FtsB